MPKVSVLVPIYNVQDYLRECLDALVGQTLKDIEIIAVNDGSTDASKQILDDYAARDARIRIIDKPNTGYGDSMNKGLSIAQGDYVGIAEPDDFVEPDLYETLVATAERHAADLVRCNYYEHEGSGGAFPFRGARDRRVHIYEEFRIPYDTPFCPADRPEVLTVRPSIWAGIYRRDMIERFGIDFAPTPGASFQDTSFAHSCWIAAQTAVVVRKALLHYRIDNAASSVKSGAKVFAICDEYARTSAFLEVRGTQAQATFGPTLNAMRYCSYVWNYNRILPEYHEQFAERWSAEMREAQAAGLLDRAMLEPRDRHDLDVLMANPLEFCRRNPSDIEWRGYRVKGWQEACVAQAPEPVAQAPASVAQAPAEDAACAVQARAEGASSPDESARDDASPAASPAASPVVSVIIPLYNVEGFVRECIESLKAQTFENFEAICVSDGSPDASLDIARLVAADDARFRFFEKDNGGQGSARNLGIAEARGKYLAFLDPDDYFAPETLDELVSFAHANDLDYLDFTAHSFYETPAARRARNESYYESRPHIPGVMTGPALFVEYQRAVEYHCSVCLHFFKRSLLDGCDGVVELRFDEDLPVHEDELFSPLLIARAKRAAYLPKAFYQRRVRDESSMTSGRGMRNVTSMYAVQNRLLAFAQESLAANAAPDFVDALLQRVAELRGIIAEDAMNVSAEELAAHAESLAAADRVDFELLTVQSARQLARERNGLDHRVGSTLLAAPRWLKNRLS